MHFLYALLIGVVLGAAIGAVVARMPLPALVRTICAVTMTSLGAGVLTFVLFRSLLFPELFFGYWVFEPNVASILLSAVGGAALHWVTAWLPGARRSDLHRVVAASCAAGTLTTVKFAWDVHTMLRF